MCVNTTTWTGAAGSSDLRLGSGEALRASLMSQPFLCLVFLLLVETDPAFILHRVVLGICGCEFPL